MRITSSFSHTTFSSNVIEASITFEEKVVCENDEVIRMKADTLCIHSDHKESVETAIAIKELLEKHECQIKSYAI